MQKNNTMLEHLDRLYEMNRLFLSFLHSRASRHCECLGLPAEVCSLLRRADDAQLDNAAALPHALFRLEFDPVATADAMPSYSSPDATALYCLQLSLLQSARNLCLDNSHLAQAFLRLPARMLIRLRCLALIDITSLACSGNLFTASFNDEPWIWEALLGAAADADQRRLRLLALQPRAGDMNLSAAAQVCVSR